MKLTTKHNYSLWLIFISLISINQSLAQCHIDDWTALKAFYESTNGDNWIDNSGWDVHIKDQNEPPQNCNLGELYGISITSNRVTSLSIAGNNLQGSIPPEIGNLKNLESLYIKSTQLEGIIPTELGTLSNLESLGLGENQLSGNIPIDLGDLSNLKSLSLSGNQLSGNIPAAFGNLTKLRYLFLQFNQLSGVIPAEIGNLKQLINLFLYSNKISGNIPSSLGGLNNIEHLNLSSNKISRSIPESLGNLNNIEWLDLSRNKISGSIPASLGNLNNITRLSLGNNKISGSIPTSLGNLSNIVSLSLSDNELTGAIPIELSNLSKITGLYLNNNKLRGLIPEELGNLNTLKYLDLSSNKLNGNIPTEFGDLSRLERLNISYNNLSGNIPVEFGNLKKLEYLKLHNNELSGSIPSNLRVLWELELQNNNLSGRIPEELGNLEYLTIIRLNDNNLTGNIPQGFGNFSSSWRVRQLSLFNNQLSGCYQPNLSTLCYIKNDEISYGNSFEATWEDFCSNANNVCSIEEEVVLGCTESEACNYNPNANYNNVSCYYESLDAGCNCNSKPGCTNVNALNYNASAGCMDYSCDYERKLQPNEYDYVFCEDAWLFVSLMKKCNSGNFVITENTINEKVTINDDGNINIPQPATNGTVKVVLNSSNNCYAEWVFNITISNNENCIEVYEGDQIFFQYPVLSSLLNPQDCQGAEVSLYLKFDDSRIYVKNNVGGTLYNLFGNVMCFDYPIGDGYCLENVNENDYDYVSKWICSKFIVDEGCTDALACNYLPNATIEDGTCTYNNCISPLIECPENNVTSICAPVSLPPALNLSAFNTTDDSNLLNSLSLQVDEQSDIQQYFTTTTRTYTIADDTGNQKTCETKYHVANQFLQAPEVSPPGAICEEDLWSYIKIGVDQYKIYSDFYGSANYELSICNTSSLICSTVDLGVDTNIPDTHSFWTTTYFKFPDETICESEASSFSIEVHPKPDAELYKQFESLRKGEILVLMDLVKSNTSGYWSGEDIYNVATPNGENIAYFSSNTEGDKKLYYTVKNEWCERNYSFIVYVYDVFGCTDNSALNYNANANIEDGSCNYAPANDFDFAEYPWLNEVVNPIDCAQKLMVTLYELESNTLVYVSSVNGGLLYSNKGNLYCEDANGKDCLTEYALVGQSTKGWSCFGGSFSIYDYIYTICEGEYVNLVADYYSYTIPCICTICAPVGPPAPPAVTWSPEAACDWAFCTNVGVSPGITTSYQSNAESVNASTSVCADGGAPGAQGGGNTITNFLVIVEQCSPAKTATVELPQKLMETAFNMYPNPTTGKVFIDLPDAAKYQINLMDISGKVIKQIKTKLDATITEINVSDLPKGMYLVELKNETHSKIQKLIIK